MRRPPASSPACDALAELRSAYVDGALADSDREKLLGHLVDCSECRAEVDDLVGVRRLLTQTRVGVEAPTTDLSRRLVSIAGDAAAAPLWTRPFRRTRPGTLPSARRTTRLRRAAAVTVAGSVVATVGVIGYAAAPADNLDAVNDPTGRAQTEFASVLSQSPLANDAVNAAMMASTTSLSDSAPPRTAPDRGTGERLAPTPALAELRRAVRAEDSLAYTGRQRVVSSRGSSTVAAQVDVRFDPGQGSQVTVLSSKGSAVLSGFVDEPVSSRTADDKALRLLTKEFTFSGVSDSTVAGRSATVVEAARPDGSGTVVARWWVDDLTGLILWHETYDDNGATTMAAGFESIRVGARSTFLAQESPALVVSAATSVLTLSVAPTLSREGWVCDSELAGLQLVRLRSDATDQPGLLHLVYSDGIATISVFEERGLLVEPGGATNWDAALGAYVRSGTTTSATWQSGGTVFTAVTDGSSALLREAVRSLPHDSAQQRTTMERVRAGWVRIFERTVG